MNTYLLPDIKIGLKHSFKTKITEKNMLQFLELSGDNNPMHCDVEYAKMRGMKDRVVYGMLSSSFYSKLVGVYLPGKYALLHAIEIQFSKPVFIGDNLTVEGEVTAINELFSQIEVKAYIMNQNSEKISKAKIKIGILNE